MFFVLTRTRVEPRRFTPDGRAKEQWIGARAERSSGLVDEAGIENGKVSHLHVVLGDDFTHLGPFVFVVMAPFAEPATHDHVGSPLEVQLQQAITHGLANELFFEFSWDVAPISPAPRCDTEPCVIFVAVGRTSWGLFFWNYQKSMLDLCPLVPLKAKGVGFPGFLFFSSGPCRQTNFSN